MMVLTTSSLRLRAEAILRRLSATLAGVPDEVAGPLAFFDGDVGTEDLKLAEGFARCGEGAAVAGADAGLEEADAGVQVVGLFGGVGDDGTDGDGGFGGLASGSEMRGEEAALIVFDGGAGVDRAEEVGEGVGKTEAGGGSRAPEAGAEHPDIG